VASIDPDVRSAMVNSVEQEIAADALTAQPSETQLRSYYAAHRARYASEGAMNVRDYVFAPSDSKAAVEAAAALRSGVPGAAVLAKWRASDSGKTADDEFYFAAKIHLGDALFEAAKDLPDGGVSAPIERADGIHVLHMLKNKKPVPFEYAAARDQVLTDFRNEAIGHLRTGDEGFLRKRANVLIADDVR
jgi:parvulin-like peptidyl-prolyl isomerase